MREGAKTLIERVKHHRCKRYLNKNIGITVKGQYLKRYCESICNGTWTEKDYIQAYEHDLIEVSRLLPQEIADENRRFCAAAALLAVFNECKE